MICYVFTEFQYLEIEKSINIWETLLAIASIAVGLFIAMSLQKRFNRNQNLYTYLINRLDSIWTKFDSFNSVIEASDKIEFTKVTKILTELQQKNRQFTKLLVEFGSIENHFEPLADELQDLFDSCLKTGGIIYYDPQKTTILSHTEKIANNFIGIYKAINSKA